MFEIIEKNQKDIPDMSDTLKNATTKICNFHKIAKNAILGIALILSEIAEKPKEYLESSGFNSISEYAEECFGYKKSYTYKLIKISKFISLIDINGDGLSVADLINDSINADYCIDVLKDSDGFEYSPSQLLELIPLTQEQITENLKDLDSSLSCKDLRELVKEIINPAIETTASIADNQETESTEDKEEVQLTDKDRILQMLEICSSMENEEIKGLIINVFQKALKKLEK